MKENALKGSKANLNEEERVVKATVDHLNQLPTSQLEKLPYADVIRLQDKKALEAAVRRIVRREMAERDGVENV